MSNKLSREDVSEIQNSVIRHAMRDMDGPAPNEPTLGETIKDIAGSLWDNLTPAFALGAEEISRQLFTGHGYVYHGDTIPEQERNHGIPIEPMHKEQDRGMEM